MQTYEVIVFVALCCVAGFVVVAVYSRYMAEPFTADSDVVFPTDDLRFRHAQAAAAAAGSTARDRLVAAARTQSALYPSVLP